MSYKTMMLVKYEVQLTEEIEGSIEIEGPLADNPDEAEKYTRELLDLLYPDAEFINVEID